MAVAVAMLKSVSRLAADFSFNFHQPSPESGRLTTGTSFYADEMALIPNFAFFGTLNMTWKHLWNWTLTINGSDWS